MLHDVVSQKLAEVSEVLNAYFIKETLKSNVTGQVGYDTCKNEVNNACKTATRGT
jgi:hypothetical protein